MKKRKALKAVSIILILCALLFIAYEVLHIRKITVSGCETKMPEEIVSLSGLRTGVSILGVDTAKVMEALSADPYIKPLSVSIVYPDCVNIEIKERKEAACIKKDDTLLIIDYDCWLLEILPHADAAPHPLALGLNLDELKVGERLGAADDFQLDVLSSVLRQASASEVGLKSVDVTYAAAVVLEIKQGYTVELGDDTRLDEKFKLLKSAVKELESMGKTGGTIDVASAASVYYR